MPAPAHAIQAIHAALPAKLDLGLSAAAPLTITYGFEDQQSS